MTDRVKRLRERSTEVMPTISAERAKIITEFYKENLGKYPPPILRALAFKELCAVSYTHLTLPTKRIV